MAQRHGNQAQPVLTGFFALPQEIRDLIYHELWAFTLYLRLTLDTSDSTSFSLLYGAAEADFGIAYKGIRKSQNYNGLD
jgi:hypothetical protein